MKVFNLFIIVLLLVTLKVSSQENCVKATIFIEGKAIEVVKEKEKLFKTMDSLSKNTSFKIATVVLSDNKNYYKRLEFDLKCDHKTCGNKTKDKTVK